MDPKSHVFSENTRRKLRSLVVSIGFFGWFLIKVRNGIVNLPYHSRLFLEGLGIFWGSRQFAVPGKLSSQGSMGHLGLYFETDLWADPYNSRQEDVCIFSVKDSIHVIRI